MNKKVKTGAIILNLIIICTISVLLISELQNYNVRNFEHFGNKQNILPNNFDENNMQEPPEKPTGEILNLDNQEEMDYLEENMTNNNISLSNNEILVNSEKIASDETMPIYFSNKMNNGGTADESVNSNIEIDNIININSAGIYEFSGTLENGQISVNANNITGYVNIILNNADITCNDAPAIFIYSKDLENKNCKVIITLKENSTNTISGGKIKQTVESWSDQDNILYYIEKDYDDDRQYYERYKYDGAISSDVSLTFEGTGILNVNSSKKEGIESKMHITINDGTYNINTSDDGINACSDGKSIITINGGNIFVNVSSNADEGDGIDSNGAININGGIVYTFACPGSDNGLDADSGVYINGGTVLSTGSMYEEIKTNNDTKIVQMNFRKEVEEDETILILDENNNPIFAYKTDRKLNTFAYSSEDFNDNNYSVYIGKSIEGSLNEKNIYTEINSFDLDQMTKQENSNMDRKLSGHPDNINMQRNSAILENSQVRITLLISIIIILVINIVILIYDISRKN